MAGKLLKHDFGGAILFISVNKEVKCNSNHVNEEDLHIWRTQEGADRKTIVHMKHCIFNSFRNAVVQTVDDDVVTLIL